MAFPKLTFMTLATAAVITTGCMSDRFGNSNEPIRPVSPIRSAPMGQVSQSDLPPPGGYPEAPGQNSDMQVASLGPAGGGMNLTPATVAGVWNASVGGMNCRIATPMTKFGQGYRAGPLRCPSALGSVNSWSVNGSQLVFYDAGGTTAATLSSSDGSNFQGQAADGTAVVLSR